MKALWTIASILVLNTAAMATVRVEKPTFNGSGCPLGSNVTHRWENGELVLSFINFAASRGDGTPLSDSRKNCVLTIGLVSDDGASFSIAATTGKGHANLGAGTQLVLSSSYFFAGVGGTTSGSYTKTGAFQGSYNTGNLFDGSTSQWSPCDATRALSVNTAIRVSGTSGSAKIEGDAFLDELRLRIETRSCD